MGVMETGKTAVAIHAPLSCRIIEANSSAVDNIHLIITDPYGAGWLFRVEPTALDTERCTVDGRRDVSRVAAATLGRETGAANRRLLHRRLRHRSEPRLLIE